MGFERRTVSYEGLVGALKERREQLGMTQLQVDYKIGWSENSLNKYENFKRQWGKHLGSQSLPLILTALGLELVIREKGDHVAVVQPSRYFGPGDPVYDATLAAHEKVPSGTAEGPEGDTKGHAVTGFAVGCMSSAEVADYLSVSSRTVKRWINNGWLNTAKVGGRRLITRSSVEAMLQAARKWEDGGARVESPPLVPSDEEAM